MSDFITSIYAMALFATLEEREGVVVHFEGAAYRVTKERNELGTIQMTINEDADLLEVPDRTKIWVHSDEEVKPYSYQQLKDLYIADLSKLVEYDDNPARARVRHPMMYEKIPLIPQANLSRYDNIWFISDTHFGHKNVIEYCDRPYEGLDHMLDDIRIKYNNKVGENDVCIWLGDVAFMGTEKTNEILQTFNGTKILVIGNHDMVKKKPKKMDFLQQHLIFEIDHKSTPLILTHYPMDNCPEPYFNVHGHVHNSASDDNLKQINVCVENTGYEPIHIDTILENAKARKYLMENKAQ